MAPAKSPKSENVAVIGASPKPDRYAHKAWKLLTEYGHRVYQVNPRFIEIEGERCYPTVTEALSAAGQLDTVTMYVNRHKSMLLTDDLLAAKPKRVIFNPGAENPDLAKQLRAAGIEPLDACTLVLLRTNQF